VFVIDVDRWPMMLVDSGVIVVNGELMESVELIMLMMMVCVDVY